MARRWFRILLKLFPSDFRGDFGPDMTETFDEELASRHGTFARSRVWLRNLWSAGRIGLRLHAEQVWQDARYALRRLIRMPVSTCTTIAALAIGIGSTTVTFAVADAFLFKPLPFREPDRLVHVWADDRKRGAMQMRAALQEFDAWRAATDVVESAAIFNYTSEVLTATTEPERIPSGRVSANAFDVLGVSAEVGRTFRPGDDTMGAAPVVVLSHQFWLQRFDGKSALGQSLELGGRKHEIVGVMPASFVFPLPITEIWVPATRDVARYTADVQPFQVVARLRDGVSIAQAEQGLSVTSGRLADAFPVLKGRAANVVPLRQALNFAYDIFSVGSLVVGVANLLVLLAVCANVSSLMLGRAVSRGHEVSVRAAIGASRFRLIRQFIVESLLLALAGGLAGGLIVMFGVSVANKTIPPDLYRPSAFALDLRGLAIMLSLALLCTLAFGLLPALRFARVNLADAMRRDGGTSSTSRANLRLQSSFVVAQVAMTIVLLSGTLLVGRSVNALGRVAPGFEASGVLTVQTILSGPKYSTTDSVRQFQDAVLGHVSNLPDVTAAAFVNYLPLNHEYDERQIDARGPTPGPGERLPSALTLVVSAAYFDLLRIPLQEGRTFAERDRAGTEPVAVISRSMATRYWPNESPIGRTFTIEKKTAPLTIVGIVADSLQVDLAERGRPQVFLPQAQDPTPYLRLLVRAAGDPAAAAPAVSRAVHAVDPYLPVTEVQPLSAVVEEFLLPQRALRGALLKLGAFSVALAVLGIYGIVACFVTERTREFGIRAALGASRRHIVGLVAGRGLRLAIRGVLIGLPAAVLAGYLLRGLLFGVGMGDPLTYLAVSAIAVGIALAASITPARRAARLDPVQAIRAP